MPLWVVSALVLIEYVAVSLLFDADVLRHATGWRWASALGHVASMGLVLLLGVGLTAALQPEGRTLWRAARPIDRTLWVPALIHLAALGGLLLASALIFSPDGPPSGSGPLWIAAWAVLGLLAALSALSLGVPPEARATLARTVGKLLLPAFTIALGIWMAAFGSLQLWRPLSSITLNSVARLLSILDQPITVDENEAIIGTPVFEIEIAPQCSGVESAGLILGFFTAYLVLARDVGGFHARVGWVFFSLIAIGLVVLSHRMAWLRREQLDADRESVAAPWLFPFLALAMASLLSGMVTDSVEWLYPLRFLFVVPVLWHYRSHHGDLRPRAPLAALGLGLLAAALYALFWVTPDPQWLETGQTDWDAQGTGIRALWLLTRTLGAVVLVPLAEELAFRGYLLPRLRELIPGRPPLRTGLALLLSSVAFGFVHDVPLADAVAGLLYGVLRLRTDLGSAVLAHTTSNLALAVVTITLGPPWWWR